MTVPDSLRRFFDEHPRPALAFSGGADSSYLLYAAKECGADVTAYLVKSQFQPMFELEHAERTAEELGTELHVLLHNCLSNRQISANPPDRCYLCKREIFGRILAKAHEDKKKCIIDATNASDDPSVRPGMKALEELGVLSPLRICGITKAQVREYSRLAGLWTWNLPSNSCLATRTPAGTELTEERLRTTEDSEDELRMLGLSDFRVRTADGGAVLETVPEQDEFLAENKQEIEKILLKYYPAVSYSKRNPGS